MIHCQLLMYDTITIIHMSSLVGIEEGSVLIFKQRFSVVTLIFKGTSVGPICTIPIHLEAFNF